MVEQEGIPPRGPPEDNREFSLEVEGFGVVCVVNVCSHFEAKANEEEVEY